MAAWLDVMKGTETQERIFLNKETTVLGRNPECDIVLPMTGVSRPHAKIRLIEGEFFIEDQNSKNKTKVNDQEIPVFKLVPLKPEDQIRICDFVAVFRNRQLPLPKDLGKEEKEEEAEEIPTTTIEATLPSKNDLVLDAHPAEKLRILLEISSNLSKTLELDHLLPKIVDSLFFLFKQADRCFIILVEEGTGRLLPKVVKARRPQDDIDPRFSRSVVRKCLETRNLFLSNNADSDPQILSQSVVDFRIRSVMCAPLLSAEGLPFGVIQLDTQERSKKFGQEDLQFLGGVANQASIALENARLHQEALVRMQMQRDMELAHQVQLGFLPQNMPDLPGYEFFVHYEPAKNVGGDYYDFVNLGPRRLAINVGDVAGKSVAAALLMAKLSSDVRYCLLSETDPVVALARLNELVCQGAGQMDRFITLATVVLDAGNHAAQLFNAGHLLPLLFRADAGTVTASMPSEFSGWPMGILQDQTYKDWLLPLAPGDCLILFSDGVIDATSTGGERFTLKGVRNALLDEGPRNPRALGQRVVKAVKRHASGRSQIDDITILCLGRLVP